MKSEIEKLIETYFANLNNSDVESIALLYTKDGVFMPPNAPTFSGIEEVKQIYELSLGKKRFNLGFTFVEIIEDHDLAIVRTLSKGTSILTETNQLLNEESRELFVLKKTNSVWKIARYIINKMS